MPDYIKVNSDGSKTYPYNIQSLRTDNPHTSFPEKIQEVAATFNVFLVQESPRPDHNSTTQTIELNQPELIAGEWHQRWKVVDLPLEAAKANALGKINSEWQQIEAAGWDSGQGHLGLSASDVALLSGAFAMAKEAAALGYPVPPLVTLENNLINFASIHEMTGLLLQYGAARSAMSVTFAERRKAAENATTLEELEAI